MSDSLLWAGVQKSNLVWKWQESWPCWISWSSQSRMKWWRKCAAQQTGLLSAFQQSRDPSEVCLRPHSHSCYQWRPAADPLSSLCSLLLYCNRQDMSYAKNEVFSKELYAFNLAKTSQILFMCLVNLMCLADGSLTCIMSCSSLTDLPALRLACMMLLKILANSFLALQHCYTYETLSLHQTASLILAFSTCAEYCQ